MSIHLKVSVNNASLTRAPETALSVLNQFEDSDRPKWNPGETDGTLAGNIQELNRIIQFVTDGGINLLNKESRNAFWPCIEKQSWIAASSIFFHSQNTLSQICLHNFHVSFLQYIACDATYEEALEALANANLAKCLLISVGKWIKQSIYFAWTILAADLLLVSTFNVLYSFGPPALRMISLYVSPLYN